MLLPFSCHVTCTDLGFRRRLGRKLKQGNLCFSTALCAVLPCFDESIHSAFHPLRATVVAEPGSFRAPYQDMDPMQDPSGDPWLQGAQSGDASTRRPSTRPSSFYPSPAWNNYRPGSVSSPSGVLGGEYQRVPQSNSAGCVGMMPGSTPVSTPLVGCPSPMMTFATGSSNVPQGPLASFSNPGSLGMFGNFTNVSQAQLGSQMGCNPMQTFATPLNGGQSPHGSASGSQPQVMSAMPGGNAQQAPLFASVPGAATNATTALGLSGSEQCASNNTTGEQCVRDAWKTANKPFKERGSQQR